MTGNSTDRRQQFRAAVLAVVMVTSVMTATVAFSGTAAAAFSQNGSVQDVPADTASATQTIVVAPTSRTGSANDGTAQSEELVFTAKADDDSTAIKIDLGPLTDNGVDISSADVTVDLDRGGEESDANSDTPDSVSITRVENGEIRLLLDDGTDGGDSGTDSKAKRVIIESIAITGLDTTNADTASGLSYLIQQDEKNQGAFSSSNFNVDASTETGTFSIAAIEVENLATSNTVTETSLAAAIEEVNDPTSGDLSSGSAGDRQVIRLAEGTYTFDTDDVDTNSGSSDNVFEASNTRIQPMDGASVTIKNSGAAQTLDIASGTTGVEIQNITFDMASNADEALTLGSNAGISLTGNTFKNVANNDGKDVIELKDDSNSVTIKSNTFKGGGLAATDAIEIKSDGGTDSLALTVKGNTIQGFNKGVVFENKPSSSSITSNTFKNNDQHVDADVSGNAPGNADVANVNLRNILNNNDFNGKYVIVEDAGGNIQDAVYGTLSTAESQTDIDNADQTTIIAGKHSSGSIDLTQDGITVTAASSGATIKATGDKTFELTSGLNNLEISGLTFNLVNDHTAIQDSGNSFTGVTITGNTFKNVGGTTTVIKLDGTHTNLDITQNTFTPEGDEQYQALGLDGAEFSGTETVEITGNQITNSETGPAIDLGANTDGGLDHSNLNLDIKNNNITRQSNGEALELAVKDANDVNIDGNTISADGGITGLNLDGADGAAVTVSDNTISGFSSENGNGAGVAIDVDENAFTFKDNILRKNAVHFHDRSSNYDESTIRSKNTLTPVVRVLNQKGGTLRNDKLYGTIAGANALAADGEFIEVNAGTYTENSVQLDTDVTISGAGASTTVKTDTANPIFKIDNGDNSGQVTITGLTFAPTQDSNDADIFINDPDTDSAGDEDVTVKNNVFNGPGTSNREAVAVGDISDDDDLQIVVTNNEIKNYAQGVVLNDGDNDGAAMTLAVVRNTITSTTTGVDLVSTDTGGADTIEVHFNDLLDNTEDVANDVGQADLTNGALDNDGNGDIKAQGNWWGAASGPADASVQGTNANIVNTDPWLEATHTNLPTEKYVVIPDPTLPIADNPSGNGAGLADNDAEGRVLVAVLNPTKANQVTDTVTLGDPSDTLVVSEQAQADSSAANPSTYLVEASESGNYTLTARETDGSVTRGSATQTFTGTAADIQVTVERDTLVADDETTINATATLVDSNGNPVDPTNTDTVTFLVENGSDAGVTRVVEESALDTATPNTNARLEISAANAGETLDITAVFDPTGYQGSATVETVQQQLNVSVSPQTVTANNSTQVTVDVSNAATGAAVNDATVELSGPGVSQTVLTNSSGVATATVNASSSGTIDVNVTADGFANANATVTVEAAGTGSPLSGTAGQFDDDADGDITAAELGDAVDQFASNQLTAAELGDVVQAFASS